MLLASIDVASAFRRLVERHHQVEHMGRHFTAGAVRSAGADGRRHVGDADAAAVLIVGELERLFGESFFSGAAQPHQYRRKCWDRVEKACPPTRKFR